MFNMPKIFTKSLLIVVQVAHRSTTPPISQMGKLRPREEKGLTQGHKKLGFSFSWVDVHRAAVLGLAGLVKHRNRSSPLPSPRNSQPEETHRETIMTHVDQGSWSPRTRWGRGEDYSILQRRIHVRTYTRRMR